MPVKLKSTGVFKAGRTFNSGKGTCTENCIFKIRLLEGFAVSSRIKAIVGNFKQRSQKSQ